MKYKIEIIKNGDIYQLSSETLYLECSKMELISKLDEIEKSIVEKKQSLLLRLLRSVNMYGFFIKGLFLYFLVMSLIFTFSKEKKELVKNYAFHSKHKCQISMCEHHQIALLLSESECLSFKVYEPYSITGEYKCIFEEK